MARAREVPGFDCDEPFARAGARVVAVRSAEIFEHSHRVLDIGEIDRLHDMRVATRRLRAAMEVFAPCFPRKRFRKTLEGVKELADALGERRDRDVEIEFLERFAEQADPGDREQLAALVARLRDEQQQANDDLAPLVATERLEKLRRRLERLVEKAAK